MKTANAIIGVCVCFLVFGCSSAKNRYQPQPVVGVIYSGYTVDYGVQQYAAPPQPTPQIVGIAPAPIAKKEYLNIGADPVDPNRLLRPGERVFALAEDTYVVTRSRSSKVSEGWLHAGEEVFAVPASDSRYWEAVAIKRCGNPILNRGAGVAPIWIFDSAAQQLTTQPIVSQTAMIQQQYPISATDEEVEQPLCWERKSGWGSVIGGGIGFIAGLFTHKPAIAASMSAGGALLGGYLDGQCLDPNDAIVAAGWGIAGYGLTKPRTHHVYRRLGGSGPAPLPANGPAGWFPGN